MFIFDFTEKIVFNTTYSSTSTYSLPVQWFEIIILSHQPKYYKVRNTNEALYLYFRFHDRGELLLGIKILQTWVAYWATTPF